MRQRIAVYGGTFDPIHNGHLRVAEEILNAFAMDRLLFVPAFVPPHKRGSEISSPFHRLAMLALGTADQQRMFVSAIELEAPQKPYTIETLGRLQAETPDAQLFFVMGADSFRDVTMWREHERLLTEYDVIVAGRPGNDRNKHIVSHLAPKLQGRCVDLLGGRLPSSENFTSSHIYLTDYVIVDISATEIREAARKNQSVEKFVPPPVAVYIEKYQLYRKS
ncbi:MAG: nicotinate (nicotinamide) nucleotide adenylyltransferase [Acidobacteria bacterium]|nr:nicotinate (nicotinamide) nucleotide adenylyltransferase [Acidobacteriota bacterium]